MEADWDELKNQLLDEGAQNTEQGDRELEKRREDMLKLLRERKKLRDAATQLYDREFINHDQEDQRAREERRNRHENELLRRLENMIDEKKNKDEKASSGRSSLNPFRLFKLKKFNYALTIPNYFCDMLMKSPPIGEIARFYENFKETFLVLTTTFPNFPILFLDRFHSPSDRQVLLSLVDARDSGGFTALHWAVHEGNLEQIELLLSNGANTELKSFMAKHKPIDRADAHPEVTKSAIHKLFQKYQDAKNNSNADNIKHMTPKKTSSEIKQPAEFPFLELPVELQILIIEKLTIQNLTRLHRVCKYFNELQILQQLTELPEMNVVFADPPEYYDTMTQGRLTVMATPTVFHFGIIVGQLYQVPSKRGADRVINEMFARIESFAKGGWIFNYKYDMQKLQQFLLNCLRMNRRIYILEQSYKDDHYGIYVEVDSQFGVGVEFKHGLFMDPILINDNDNWTFRAEDFGYYYDLHQ